MSSTKKGKLHIKVNHVDSGEKLHVLWPMKYCTKAGVNLLSLTCKLLGGSKISSDCKNIIVIQSTSGKIVLDCQVKT